MGLFSDFSTKVSLFFAPFYQNRRFRPFCENSDWCGSSDKLVQWYIVQWFIIVLWWLDWCRLVYSCVQLCTVVYSCVQLCTVVYSCVQLCTEIYSGSGIQGCTVVYIGVL